MHLETAVVFEKNIDRINFGQIRPGNNIGLPNNLEDGAETIVLRYPKERTCGEVYIFPEIREGLVGVNVSEDDLKEEHLEHCIWPGEVYSRRLININQVAGLLVVEHTTDSPGDLTN